MATHIGSEFCGILWLQSSQVIPFCELYLSSGHIIGLADHIFMGPKMNKTSAYFSTIKIS